MAAPNPKTLDIKEPQIIQHFPHDAGGFYWHHRILLEKAGPGIWISLSPDGDLDRIDLNQSAHIALERKSDFPVAQSPYTYAFDEISKAELEGHRRRARLMCNLFNEASFADVESFEWLVADVHRPDFGVAFKDSDIEDSVVLQDSALIEYEGDIVYAVKVPVSQKAEWIKSRDTTKGDARLLGSHKDAHGRRFLEFGKAIDLMTSAEFSDWPLSGPRACMELLKSIREGTSDLTTYHLQWARNSGVSSYAACLHEHRCICDYLKYFIATDQVDVSCLLGAEMMCRRLITIETAVTRNPQAPDFSGLDLVMESGIGQSGEARTAKFTEWISAKLKEKAQVQKQARLFKEEFGRVKPTQDPADGGGKGRGRGRGKKQGRGGDSTAASTA